MLGSADAAESIFKICEHLAANPGRSVSRAGGKSPTDASYAAKA